MIKDVAVEGLRSSTHYWARINCRPDDGDKCRRTDGYFSIKLPAERAAAFAAAWIARPPSALSISSIERRLVSRPISQKAKAPTSRSVERWDENES
jgi:hypothetical protein